MLFAIDIAVDSLKGKYIYAVVTNKKFRGKGYMRQLFEKISVEYIDKYDFLCLRPMDNSLFAFYEKLGFVTKFKKSTVYKYSVETDKKLISFEDINDIKMVRKYLLRENYVEYCDEFYKLILAYCDVFTDDILNPTVFVVKESLSGAVKEILGDINKLPAEFINIPLLIKGEEFDFAMVKSLKKIDFDNKYLGFALD